MTARIAAAALCLAVASPGSPAAGQDSPSVLERFLAGADCAGCGPGSCDRVKDMVRAILSGAKPRVVAGLLRGRVRLVVMPVGVKLTDMPQARPLLEDRREIEAALKVPMDEWRGVANVRQPDGSIAVIVREPAPAVGKEPPPGFTVAHELGHAIHEYGLSEKESALVARLQRAAKKAGRASLDKASLQHPGEFFAQATAAWFAVHYDRDGASPKDAAWLRRHEPALRRVLESVYGAARGLPSAEPVVLECRDYSDCYNMAGPLGQQGECRGALAAYGRALDYEASHPWAWYHRGLLRKMSADLEGAQTDYAKALSLAAGDQGFQKSLDTGDAAFWWEDPSRYYGPGVECR